MKRTRPTLYITILIYCDRQADFGGSSSSSSSCSIISGRWCKYQRWFLTSKRVNNFNRQCVYWTANPDVVKMRVAWVYHRWSNQPAMCREDLIQDELPWNWPATPRHLGGAHVAVHWCSGASHNKSTVNCQKDSKMMKGALPTHHWPSLNRSLWIWPYHSLFINKNMYIYIYKQYNTSNINQLSGTCWAALLRNFHAWLWVGCPGAAHEDKVPGTWTKIDAHHVGCSFLGKMVSWSMTTKTGSWLVMDDYQWWLMINQHGQWLVLVKNAGW